jgi:hypothetical protein
MKPPLLCMRIMAVGLFFDACVSLAEDASPIRASQNISDAGSDERPEWEVKFQDNLRPIEYARELDYFGIELGAIGKNGEIQYASQLSKPKPVRRLGAVADEHRTYITWKVGTLATFDVKLLAKAGIATKDKTIAHYYPEAMTRELIALERAFADREQHEILRTRFQVRARPDNENEFEFFVDEQDPRIAKSGN